jgi:rhomboid protease GluP
MTDPVPLPPTPTLAEIPAYSKRQAMDWSLVLASQGIEAIILKVPETERWTLQVPPAELQRAQESIRLYRAENRGWSWRQDLPGLDLELHWGAIVFCVILTLFHSASSFEIPAMRTGGTMDPIKVLAGQWWRLFTPVFLHDDLAHLAANVTFGIIVLGLSMARFGAGLTLLATFLAGAVGNLFGLMFHDRPYTGLGASGMMMGALGMLAIHSIHLWRANRKAARYVTSGVGAGFLLFVLFGVSPGSDVLAHLGGFLAGLLFGAILALLPPKLIQKPAVNVLALIFFVTFSALVWILALR